MAGQFCNIVMWRVYQIHSFSEAAQRQAGFFRIGRKACSQPLFKGIHLLGQRHLGGDGLAELFGNRALAADQFVQPGVGRRRLCDARRLRAKITTPANIATTSAISPKCIVLDPSPPLAYLTPMAARPILTAPDPRLKAVSVPVEKVDADIRKLIADMTESMYAADGIGLAAVQIGVAKRVIVIDLNQKDGNKNPRAYINPKILWASDEMATFEEGCLSVPEIWDDVERPARIRAEYLDAEGKAQTLEADGMLATCLQHEMDHLEGVLFIDHLSRLKRSMALKKLTKAKKQMA